MSEDIVCLDRTKVKKVDYNMAEDGVNLYRDCEFEYVDFSGQIFKGKKFYNCVFLHCNFSNAHITNCVFGTTEILDCRTLFTTFEECNMCHVLISESIFFWAQFIKCTLSHVRIGKKQ